MDNKIEVFKNEQFGEVRTILIGGEPWFVVADVCAYFGVANRNRIMQNVDAEDKGGTQMDTPGGVQTVAIVNESGLYNASLTIDNYYSALVNHDFYGQDRSAGSKKPKTYDYSLCEDTL